MQLRRYTWTVILLVILHITSTNPIPFRSDDYYYLDPDMGDDIDYIQPADLTDMDYQPYESDSDYVMIPRSVETTTECETEPLKTTEVATTPKSIGAEATTCIAIIPGAPPRPMPIPVGYPEQSTPMPQSAQPAQPFPPIQPPTQTPTQSQITPPTAPPATPPPSIPSIPHQPTPSHTKPLSTTTTTSKLRTTTEEETTTCIPEDEMNTTQKATTLPSPDSHAIEATTCISVKSGGGVVNASFDTLLNPPSSLFPALSSTDQEVKTRALHSLVQHLYVAQARVQLEVIEIKKAQAVANSAQQQLEDAANHVRGVTAALQNAQQEVASAAIRAQTAQLQLAAHDQLLFAARQDVDALSSQMVGLQAAEGIAVPTVKFDISSLLDKLKQPLPAAERPTAVPPVIAGETAQQQQYEDYDYD